MFTNMDQVNHFFEQRKSLGIKPGMERMDQLLKYVNNPQRGLKAIHIAGTNGKGSTVQYIKNALTANGYRVGIFTSPSFQGLRGHILINDLPISTFSFINLLNKLYPFIKQLDNDDMNPTEFEIITTIMFLYFSETVDFALIEVGMGGREDTTNCFLPILSIITNVSLDHTAFLGNSLVEIAFHKAGIIKHNVPVIVGHMDPDVLAVINKEVKLKQAELFQMGVDYSYFTVKQEVNGQSFAWRADGNSIFSIRLEMPGLHQVKNASIAIMALKIIMDRTKFLLDMELSLAAIGKTQIPGRFEILQKNPTIILDGAHNPAGIDAFLQTVQTSFKDQKRQLIFAGFKDKELQKMVKKCIPYFDLITLTSFDHPRAANAVDIAPTNILNNIKIIEPWKNALKSFEKQKNRNETCLFITGSIHFIVEIRDYLKNNYSKHNEV